MYVCVVEFGLGIPVLLMMDIKRGQQLRADREMSETNTTSSGEYSEPVNTGISKMLEAQKSLTISPII